jgi:hypothetical protein
MGGWRYGSTYSKHGHWVQVSGRLHAPTNFSPRKETSLPSGEVTGRVFPLLGIEIGFLDQPARSLVTVMTELSRPPHHNVQKVKLSL